MENNNEFKFTYNAPSEAQRKEIESIRRQYTTSKPQSESKMERLLRLDNTVKNNATMYPLILGVVGTLISGLGMAMVLEWNMILFGVIVGIIGLVPIALAYPLHKYVLKKMKNKYGDEILRLSEELLNENNLNAKS